MLAREAGAAFDDPRYLFEIKWDGYRALAERRPDGALHLWGRSGRDLARDLPALRVALAEDITRPCLIDGEIVALAGGKSDFLRLAQRREPIVYVAFDLLRWRDEDLLALPLRERRARLADRLAGGGDRLLRSDGVTGAGVAYFRAICDLGLEGMMAKNLASPYLPGTRSSAWLKILNLREATFAVVGAEPAAGERVAALWLADAAGRTVARVAGIPIADARRVRARLVGAAHGGADSQGRVWPAAPGLRCRVRFRSVLPDGKLRHPVYAGLEGEGAEDG
jgi:ATP-dependent DNA ligase